LRFEIVIAMEKKPKLEKYKIIVLNSYRIASGELAPDSCLRQALGTKRAASGESGGPKIKGCEGRTLEYLHVVLEEAIHCV
jgi:hypothetical protein